MSRQTTVLLSLSPRTSGAWGDSVYRVSHSIQLVEGGSAAYWLTTPTLPAQNLVDSDVLRIDSPDPNEVLSSVLMVMAVHVGGPAVEGLLLDTHNIEVRGESGCTTRHVVEFWELEERLASNLARLLVPTVRIAVTILDEMNAFTEEVIAALQAFGFEIEVFRLAPFQSAA